MKKHCWMIVIMIMMGVGLIPTHTRAFYDVLVVPKEDVKSVTPLELNKQYDFSFDLTGTDYDEIDKTAWYSFTPAKTGGYIFFGLNDGNSDCHRYVLNGDQYERADGYSSPPVDTRHFMKIETLTAGTTYYYCTSMGNRYASAGGYSVKIIEQKAIKDVEFLELGAMMQDWAAITLRANYQDGTSEYVRGRLSFDDYSDEDGQHACAEVTTLYNEQGIHLAATVSEEDAFEAMRGNKKSVPVTIQVLSGTKDKVAGFNQTLTIYSLAEMYAKATELSPGDLIDATVDRHVYKIDVKKDEKYSFSLYGATPEDMDYAEEISIDLYYQHADRNWNGAGNLSFSKYGQYNILENGPRTYLIFVHSLVNDYQLKFGMLGVAVPVRKVSLPATKSMTVGDTLYLGDDVVVDPENTTDASCVWSTSNAMVATVSKSGNVIAKSAGVAQITVSVGGIKAICDITVAEAPKKEEQMAPGGESSKQGQQITGLQTKQTIRYQKLKKKKQTFKLKAKAQGAVTYKKTAGNKKITVSKMGKVTVKKGLKKGTYKITLTVTAADADRYNKCVDKKTIKVIVK